MRPCFPCPDVRISAPLVPRIPSSPLAFFVLGLTYSSRLLGCSLHGLWFSPPCFLVWLVYRTRGLCASFAPTRSPPPFSTMRRALLMLLLFGRSRCFFRYCARSSLAPFTCSFLGSPLAVSHSLFSALCRCSLVFPGLIFPRHFTGLHFLLPLLGPIFPAPLSLPRPHVFAPSPGLARHLGGPCFLCVLLLLVPFASLPLCIHC